MLKGEYLETLRMVWDVVHRVSKVISVWRQTNKLFVAIVCLPIWCMVALELVGIKQSVSIAVSYVGPSVLNQDLHLVDQAELSRLRTIRTSFEPRIQPAGDPH